MSKSSKILKVLFFLFITFSKNNSYGKDPENPPRNVYDTHRDILVIPDVHGDLEALFSALIHMKVLDINGEITIEPSKVSDIVFLGDFVDRGPYSRQVLDWVIYFKARLASMKVRLHHLFANHELRLLAKNYSGMLEMDRRNFIENSTLDATKHIPLIISDPKFPYRKFFLESPIWLKIGNYGFVHAGLHPQMLKWDWEKSQSSAFQEIRTILELNSANRMHEFDMEDLHPTLADDGFVETRWLSKEADEKKDAETINKLLEKFGVHHLFVGHTIQENGARSMFNKKIFLMDGGMSQWNLRDQPYISAAIISKENGVILTPNIERLKVDTLVQNFIKSAFSESIRRELILRACADPRFFRD